MKRRKLLLVGVPLAVALTFLSAGVLGAVYMVGDGHEVTSEIGWWPNQSGVEVSSFDVHLSEDTVAIWEPAPSVSVSVAGEVTGRPGWRPHICRVQYSQRWIDPYRGPDEPPEAEVEIVPVACTSHDDGYEGGPVAFEVSFARELVAGGWGTNHYTFRAQGQESRVAFDQIK